MDDTFLSDKFPGFTIRVIGQTDMAASAEAAVDTVNKAEIIAERLISLADAVNGAIGLPEDLEEAPGEGRLRADPSRPSIKEALRESMQIAMRNAADETGLVNEGLAGIRIDERGLLKVDRAMFAEALTGKKEETSRFVNNFGSSLHDRTSYYFHPFATLFAGAPDAAGLQGPGNKKGVADDGDDKKAGFEKRLNELQMLLKSSYELKGSFMQKRFSDQGGPDEEVY